MSPTPEAAADAPVISTDRPGAAASARRTGALPYTASLDGIRAVAVALVLCFHGGFAWAKGGFLGVSMFFVLSGYLITSLLTSEWRGEGRISLVRFWARRLRRLAPASLALLFALLLIGAGVGITSRTLGDLRAAALNIANWWFIGTGRNYADITASPSLVDHFWSLAIEEQFYLLYPFLVWACMRWGRRQQALRRLGLMVGLLAVGSFSLHFIIGDVDRIYLGTDTRALELLIGAGLALVSPLGRGGRHRRPHAGAQLVGWAGLAVLVAASAGTGVRDPWLYRGGLAALALCSAALIWSAVRPGWLSVALGWSPLVHLGRISYGVYLFHWPVFVWLDERRTGLDPWPLFGVRLVITLLLAELSFHLLEQPIRRGRLFPGRRGTVAWTSALSVFVVLTLVVPTTVDDQQAIKEILADQSRTGLGLVTVPTSDGGDAGAGATTTTVPPRPVIGLIGDSVPTVLAAEVAPRSAELGAGFLNFGIPACDGARGHPDLRYGPGREITEQPDCTQWERTWPPLLESSRPRALVFMLGGAAVLDRRIDGGWTNACRPDFQRWYTSETLYRLDWVAQRSDARLILTISPWADYGTLGLPRNHQDRTDCLNRVYESVLAQRPAVARLDVRDWLCPQGRRACQRLRSDGLHYRGAGAWTFAQWLVPQVLSLAARPSTAPSETTTTARPTAGAR